MLAPVSAHAATFTVTNTTDSEAGSLRQAILDANFSLGLGIIAFNIHGAGPHTILPLSALPTITDPVIIDGYTQSGASPNTNGPGQGLNTVLMIELDGTNAEAGANGLRIIAGSSIVRGLAINRFAESGVRVDHDGNNSIEGNFIGTNVTGNVAFGNRRGLWLGSANNKAGGTTSDAANLISGNTTNAGVFIIGAAAMGNLVQGNYLGTDAAGNGDLGNFHGVFLTAGASGSTIGGTIDGAGNTIAFNGFAGVTVFSGTGNAILANSILANTGASGLGIELIDRVHGVTPNDEGDVDVGPNNLQNFPVLTIALATPARLVVRGVIDTPNPETVTIEFFANPVPTPGGDPSGHGEGAVFLGRASPNPQGLILAVLPAVEIGTLISATATDADRNTSEFAANIEATAPGQ